MKNLLYTFIFCALVHLFSGSASAHGSGPPYVRINGSYANTYPLTVYSSPTAFPVGADFSSSPDFVVNTTLEFTIETKPFTYAYGPTATEENGSKLTWSFGDNTPAVEGWLVTHTYTKPGTYFIQMELQKNTDEDFLPINSIQINILPYKGYQMPRAVIYLDKKHIANPAKDFPAIYLDQPVHFDASYSQGNIIKYMWDFGDETAAAGKSVDHSYQDDLLFPTAATLRVVDTNNLISDTFVFFDSVPKRLDRVSRVISFLRSLLRLPTN